VVRVVPERPPPLRGIFCDLHKGRGAALVRMAKRRHDDEEENDAQPKMTPTTATEPSGSEGRTRGCSCRWRRQVLAVAVVVELLEATVADTGLLVVRGLCAADGQAEGQKKVPARQVRQGEGPREGVVSLRRVWGGGGEELRAMGRPWRSLTGLGGRGRNRCT